VKLNTYQFNAKDKNDRSYISILHKPSWRLEGKVNLYITISVQRITYSCKVIPLYKLISILKGTPGQTSVAETVWRFLNIAKTDIS
jgi:hypothetical protein